MIRVMRTAWRRRVTPVYGQGRAATEGAAGRPRKSFRASLLAIAQILASTVAIAVVVAR